MMKIHHGYEGLRITSPVVTIGAFDGIHRGHRCVLERLLQRASEINGSSVVMTFHPHPRQILEHGADMLPLLTTTSEKIELIEKTGVDHLVIIGFDHELSNREACEFISGVLVREMGARHLIVGFNHRFGRKGEGDFKTIQKCAAEMNLSVEMVDGLVSGNVTISSSSIRNALETGRLHDANEMLGYSYFMKGTIVEGRKIGRSIGYPTANINPLEPGKLIPSNGVYAVEVYVDGIRHKGAMSIGINPTIDKNSSRRTIEVNIFNFEEEIYGREVKVVFRYRIRDEIEFSSLAELASRIEVDRQMALKLLEE